MNQSDTSERCFRLGLPNRADALSTSIAASYAGIMAFMAVATEGSFAKAGERLGVGRSAVSRNVQKLEMQLSTRLFLRTTRSTQLTREGERFFENCHQGVTHIAEAMNDMLELREGPPRGLVRISSTVGFGRKVVAPLLEKFMRAFPDIAVDLLLEDRPMDFASEQIDVAFRCGRIEDSSIIAKQLIPMQMALCAAPSYVEAHGLPNTLDELCQHDCINFRCPSGRVFEWEFKVDGRVRKYLPTARLTLNDADLVLHAVLQGSGIAQLAGYQIRDHIAAKELVVALARHVPDDGGHYICYLSRQHLPTRIRVFIDFMTEQIRALNLNCLTGFNAEAGGSLAAGMVA
ncbi:LysR family transcriptional regulator [Paraburkholderia ginsengiterrae]|uniref:LysR family transcriptional regulator n=1 Tax=Paraburkholderia ginsengiterrae TaxID=1462993 RepID=A0A1A9NGP8_9BURK|nr:LysR family transcriptional regulator [Paraburkholderia ginsengiterrae]OAJ61725.1 LysR family transcriptional regulator [Paraburkholderia ginsengiterrae]OAJ65324.1 LysR family transcriptional regulator [Paraburkholderia ginsengiterrae]